METSAVSLRPLHPEELAWLLEIEREAAAGGYVRNNDEATHREQMADSDYRYLVVEGTGKRLAYVILRGLSDEDACIQLKRIVVAEPGGGTGQVVMRALITHVFSTLGAHRLWLDTLLDNTRSQHVYRKLGFVREGQLREAVFLQGRHQDLIVYALLASEWPAQ